MAIVIPLSIDPDTPKKLLQSTSINYKNLDLLINASVCRDFLEPATAAFIHKGLELPSECPFLDVSNACLGVLQSLFFASSLIQSKAIKSALIISAENSRPLIEQSILQLLTVHSQKNISQTKQVLKKMFSNFTIGSGCFGILLVHKSLLRKTMDQQFYFKIVGGVQLVDSQSADLCTGDGNLQNLMMETNSSLMLERGVRLAKLGFEKFCEEFNVFGNTFDHFVTHQVGKMHQQVLYDCLKIPLEKDYSNFEKVGNCGSVALMIAFCELAKNLIYRNEKKEIALLGIGSGLSTLMMRLQWTQI